MTRIQKRKVSYVLSIVSLFILAACSVPARETSSALAPAPETTRSVHPITAVNLPSPKDEAQKSYLGLTSETQTFTLDQIPARILLINVFSMYCPHCQKEAPNTNLLFKTIEDNPELKGKIKLIGIGARNSDYEVGLFRDKFEVPFPLFPDKDLSISEALGVQSTPTLIGLKMDPESGPVLIVKKIGAIGEAEAFLGLLSETARLKD